MVTSALNINPISLFFGINSNSLDLHLNKYVIYYPKIMSNNFLYPEVGFRHNYI